MKKLLFITPRIPIPAISGGLLSTYSSISFLAKKFKLDIITFCDDTQEKKQEYIAKLEKIGVNNIYFIKNKVKNRSIINIIKSLFHYIPLSIYRNQSKDMQNVINCIASNYDIIYADHWLTMQFVPSDYTKTIILKEHNAEYIMWKRLMEIEKNIIKKTYLKIELNKIKRYEANICKVATNVIVITNEDKESLCKIGVDSNKITMLPGIILSSVKNCNSFDTREDSILYVGTLSWGANIDGLIYFLKYIYPKIKEKKPNIKIYIVGKNPPQQIKQFANTDSSIILTGFVEDLSEYFNKAKLFIVYLRYGGGIKIKVLEALSKGLPVVANQIGLEGIETFGTKLATTDEEFSNSVCDLIDDNNRLEVMSQEGRKYINSNFSEKEYIMYFNNIN